MSRFLFFLLLFLVILCFCVPGAHAFGAGNIPRYPNLSLVNPLLSITPSFAYLEGKAFRHGDIEDILEDMAKRAGGGFAIGNLLGRSKFNGLDIKRVYFGNWLRDYSQAVDIAMLKRTQLQVSERCPIYG
jgi:hypothetical protein